MFRIMRLGLRWNGKFRRSVGMLRVLGMSRLLSLRGWLGILRIIIRLRRMSPSESGKSPVLDRVVVVQGLAASPGLHAGRAKIVVGLQDAGRMMKDKDILVTRMTNPDWVPYMKIAGAIVTEDGGTTCHAAIVSREMGIPCIVGARNATKVLQTGKEYTVDAKAGTRRRRSQTRRCCGPADSYCHSCYLDENLRQHLTTRAGGEGCAGDAR